MLNRFPIYGIRSASGSDRSTALRVAVIGLVFTFATCAQGADTARVTFLNSCSPEIQDQFNHAVTLLHSFEYPETIRLFQEIIRKEPQCAMAYWGAAMSLWQPLWAPPDEAELAKGAELLRKTEGLTKTSREAAYLSAAKQFFSSTDPTTHPARVKAYELAMRNVYENHLDDPEAALFYALSLLASADPRDKSYANQFKSAVLLNWVRSSQPRHPGVLHYLIHSYDFPGLAHLALDAAKIYAKSAPESAHAQHMPSHIFTRLGLWELSLSSNHDSIHSAEAYTERAHLPGQYDEGLHSLDYLMYAMLQTARDGEAKELLDKLQHIDRTNVDNFKVAYTYAASPARHAIERRQWDEASRLTLARPDFPWTEFGWAKSIHYFARGIGAARSGKLDQAREDLRTIETLRAELPATTLAYWREEVQVQEDSVRSWILFKEGKRTEALSLASAAAAREDSVDKHPVTPGEVIPARELYADMLFDSGRLEESLTQYEIVLRSSPNRLNTMIGAAKAASALGRQAPAEEYYEKIRTQTRQGNHQRIGIETIWMPESPNPKP